ncbi:MAG: hypothetical protein KJ896_04430, partial [Nanoarchaeota archaeon]|nr:hypothetical protein [Nanoarchaeota archaeon]
FTVKQTTYDNIMFALRYAVFGGDVPFDGPGSFTVITYPTQGEIVVMDNGTSADPTDDYILYTPDDGFIERLEAIKSVIDLKRRLQDDGKPEKTLLDTMASYWNQVPIFYGDLNTIFHVMATEYQDHHKFSDFKNWCFGYAFRDGILEVAEKVIEKYGVEFDAEVHESGFGLAKHGERRILPGVSAEEFMTTLCQLSKSLANNSHWSGNINARYINSGARDWEKALTKARDLTLKEQSNISSRLELM